MKKEERTFNSVIQSMEETENDKDKFLKAARLQRHEQDRKYELERLTLLLNYLVAIIGMLCGFGFFGYLFYLSTVT